MKRSALITAALSIGVLFGTLNPAQAQSQPPPVPTIQPPATATAPQWDWSLVRDPEAGLTHCLIAVHEVNPTGAPGAVNVTVSKSPGKLTVNGEYAKVVTVKLACQPGTTYVSSLGTGYSVGSPTPALPGQSNPTGDHPVGMAWSMTIGDTSGQPITATITGSGVWGSNTITVTTVPFAAPASTDYVNQTSKTTADAAVGAHASDTSLHGRGHTQVFGLGAGYVHSIDSDDGRPRSGFSGFMEGYINVFPQGSPFRLSLGAQFQTDNRFKPVRNVSNLQPVGRQVDWSSTYFGPHIGINLLAPPNSNVAFVGNFRASLGLWHFVDSTVPLSQTAISKDLQVGPAETESAFAGKFSLSAGVAFYKTVTLTLDLSYTRAFTPITLWRGPADQVNYERPRGTIGDWGFGPTLTAMF